MQGGGRLVSRGIGAGVMAGSLPRDHLRHAWCGDVCVPDFLHGDFVRALRLPDADAVLRAFYTETLADLEGPIGDDPVKFWRACVAAHWPTKRLQEGTRTTALKRAGQGLMKA